MRLQIVCLSVLLFLAGCGVSRHAIKQPPEAFNSNDIYNVGSGDVLDISVWKSPELSVQVPVRPDGRISVPLVGDVVARGKSVVSLSKELEASFTEYVRNPKVTVIVKNPVSGKYLQRVRATGALRSPVSLQYLQGMTVLDIVLEAGGLTEFASGNKAKLYRTIDGKVEAYPIYLNDILKKGRLETNYKLNPTDIISIPERSF